MRRTGDEIGVRSVVDQHSQAPEAGGLRRPPDGRFDARIAEVEPADDTDDEAMIRRKGRTYRSAVTQTW